MIDGKLLELRRMRSSLLAEEFAVQLDVGEATLAEGKALSESVWDAHHFFWLTSHAGAHPPYDGEPHSDFHRDAWANSAEHLHNHRHLFHGPFVAQAMDNAVETARLAGTHHENDDGALAADLHDDASFSWRDLHNVLRTSGQGSLVKHVFGSGRDFEPRYAPFMYFNRTMNTLHHRMETNPDILSRLSTEWKLHADRLENNRGILTRLHPDIAPAYDAHHRATHDLIGAMGVLHDHWHEHGRDVRGPEMTMRVTLLNQFNDAHEQARHTEHALRNALTAASATRD